MRTLFRSAAALALLAIVATPLYAQDSQDGAPGPIPSENFIRTLTGSLDAERGPQALTVDWSTFQMMPGKPTLKIDLSLDNGTTWLAVEPGAAGLASGDGLTQTTRLSADLLRQIDALTGPVTAKVRGQLMLDGKASGYERTAEVRLAPPNQPPRIRGTIGTLNVPFDAAHPDEHSVLVDATVTDREDQTSLSFTILMNDGGEIPTNVTNAPSLPVSLVLPPRMNGRDQDFQYQLVVNDGYGGRTAQDFTVSLKGRPVAPPPAPVPPLLAGSGKPDPTPPAAPPAADPGKPERADPAPVSSAVNHAPSGLRLTVDPFNHTLVGGNTVSIAWIGSDVDNDPLRLCARMTDLKTGQIAPVISTTGSPLVLQTLPVNEAHRYRVEVWLNDGKLDGDAQPVDLLVQPVDRVLVDEHEFREDVVIQEHTMGRRAADAGVFSPGAVDYEWYTDEHGNRQVRERKPDSPPSRDKSAKPEKKAAPLKRK